MEKVALFRRYADGCRAIAQKAPSEMLRIEFGKMAREWSQLADERERRLSAQKIRGDGVVVGDARALPKH